LCGTDLHIFGGGGANYNTNHVALRGPVEGGDSVTLENLELIVP
jgi:hypothetical protein